MTFEEWAETIPRGKTINPAMAFAAGAASRDAEIAFVLPHEKINELQIGSIMDLIHLCKQAHMADIHVRINGETKVIEADWVKHMRRLA